jgi:hypothetical protein
MLITTVGGATMETVLSALRALQEHVTQLRHARAAAAREELYEGESRARGRYFAAASDHADLERRQRSWDRAE